VGDIGRSTFSIIRGKEQPDAETSMQLTMDEIRTSQAKTDITRSSDESRQLIHASNQNASISHYILLSHYYSGPYQNSLLWFHFPLHPFPSSSSSYCQTPPLSPPPEYPRYTPNSRYRPNLAWLHYHSPPHQKHTQYTKYDRVCCTSAVNRPASEFSGWGGGRRVCRRV
jgi:hypothetical protein